MQHRHLFLFAAALAGSALLACGKDQTMERDAPVPESMPSATAGAELEPVAETNLDTAPGVELDANAKFYDTGDAVRVVVNVKEAPPGKHGVHVHEKGDCSDIPGKSMGSHFAPGEQEHGLPHESERHLGDLGNVEIANDGTGQLDILVPGANLDQGDRASFAGRALVIHETEDTGEGESGESGAPIACGVIGP